MTIPGALETVASGLNVANALADAAREDRASRVRLRPIINALRGIYFTPRGTLKILGTLARSEKPDPEDIRETLIDFNDAEWRVDHFRDRLDFEYLERYDLSLRQRRSLQEIAWGKKNLRRDVQDALNEELTTGNTISADDARVLLLRVEALNKVIESLEEEFL